MKTEYIKDFYGKIFGIIETDSFGNQTIKSFPDKKIIGYYKVDKNITTDFYGKILSQGNTAIALLYK